MVRICSLGMLRSMERATSLTAKFAPHALETMQGAVKHPTSERSLLND